VPKISASFTNQAKNLEYIEDILGSGEVHITPRKDGRNDESEVQFPTRKHNDQEQVAISRHLMQSSYQTVGGVLVCGAIHILQQDRFVVNRIQTSKSQIDHNSALRFLYNSSAFAEFWATECNRCPLSRLVNFSITSMKSSWKLPYPKRSQGYEARSHVNCRNLSVSPIQVFTFMPSK
jgi:hypothetical protein